MTCTRCNGIGLLDKIENDITYAQEVCSTCKGAGFIGDKPVEAKIKKVKK